MPFSSGWWIPSLPDSPDFSPNPPLSVTIKSCFLLTAGCLFYAVALNAQDITAPVVTSISISPASIEVGSGPVNVTVTIGIDDDQSGVYGGNITLVSPTENHVKNVSFDASKRTAGNQLSGTYQMVAEIPGYGTSGTWEFAVYVFDNDNNNRTYGTGSGEEAFPIPADATFTVTNAGTPDTTGPVATQIVFSPLSADVSGGPALITGTFDLADTPSGVDYGYIYVRDPNGDLHFSGFGNIDAAHRTSGTQYNGSYQTVATIPQNAMDGLWKVFLGVRDKLGKYTFTAPVNVLISGAADPLAVALDAPQFTWINGTPGWSAQTSVTHDGVDAAASDPIADEEYAIFETTIIGPGTLSFYWKVDSEYDYDFLSVDIADGFDYREISGDEDWQEETFEIPAGSQTVVWSYTKDDSGAEGADMGWVDQVSFTPTSTITDAPLIVEIGVSPGSVDVSTTPDVLQVTLRITDEDEGFLDGEITMRGPTFQQVPFYFNGTTSRTTGDEFDGIYVVNVPVPLYLEPGQWELGVRVSDLARNSRNYPNQPPFDLPDDTTFTVVNTGPSDIQRPVVGPFAVSTNFVDPSTGPVSVTVDVTISDTLSGLSTAYGYLHDPNGGFFGLVVLDASNRTSGDRMNGTYQFPLTFPMGAAAGVYSIRFATKDAAGNNGLYGFPAWPAVPGPGIAAVTAGSGTGSSYAAFTVGSSLTGNDAPLTANPDNDWASNALEFLLGLDPTVASTPDPALYQVTRVGNELRLDVKPAAALTITSNGDFLNVRNAPGNLPVRVTGQIATDLAGPWTNVLPVSVGGGTYRVALTIDPGVRGFCRLKFLDP